MKANKLFLFSIVLALLLIQAPYHAQAGNSNLIDNIMYQIESLIMQPIITITCNSLLSTFIKNGQASTYIPYCINGGMLEIKKIYGIVPANTPFSTT